MGDALRAQYDDLVAIRKNKRCRVCHSPIAIALRYLVLLERQRYYLRCGCWPEPPQLQHVESTYEAYKRGADLPLHTANVIERKLRGEEKLSTAIQKAETEKHIRSFGDVSGDQVAKAIGLVERYGFSPYLHLTVYQKRVTTTVDGLYWWVRTHSGVAFDMVSEVIPTTEKAQYGVAEHEIGVIAKVYRRGENRPACTGFGRASSTKGREVVQGSFVEAQHPYRMAEKRAEAQALRKFLAIGDVTLPEELEETAPWNGEGDPLEVEGRVVDESTGEIRESAGDAAEPAPAQRPAIQTIGEFLNAARGEWAYADAQAICGALGCEKPGEVLKLYGSFDKAWARLAEINASEG